MVCRMRATGVPITVLLPTMGQRRRSGSAGFAVHSTRRLSDPSPRGLQRGPLPGAGIRRRRFCLHHARLGLFLSVGDRLYSVDADQYGCNEYRHSDCYLPPLRHPPPRSTTLLPPSQSTRRSGEHPRPSSSPDDWSMRAARAPRYPKHGRQAVSAETRRRRAGEPTSMKSRPTDDRRDRRHRDGRHTSERLAIHPCAAPVERISPLSPAPGDLGLADLGPGRTSL